MLFKVESSTFINPRKVMLYRALPDVSLPTSERQLWEERHFFDTHPSPHRDHPELEGQGSGLWRDTLIMEESRGTPVSSALESDTSLYEFPLHQPGSSVAFGKRGSPSPSRNTHSDSHPFWTKEHWVHFADIEHHQVHSTKLNVAGKEFTANEFFEKAGWLGKTRSFTAWDGNMYRWDLKDRNVKLYRCSQFNESPGLEAELLIAEFDAATASATPIAGSQRRKVTPPSLVIYPAGEPIIDLIIVTFIYGELLTRDPAAPTQQSHREKRRSLHVPTPPKAPAVRPRSMLMTMVN